MSPGVTCARPKTDWPAACTPAAMRALSVFIALPTAPAALPTAILKPLPLPPPPLPLPPPLRAFARAFGAGAVMSTSMPRAAFALAARFALLFWLTAFMSASLTRSPLSLTPPPPLPNFLPFLPPGALPCVPSTVAVTGFLGAARDSLMISSSERSMGSFPPAAAARSAKRRALCARCSLHRWGRTFLLIERK